MICSYSVNIRRKHQRLNSISYLIMVLHGKTVSPVKNFLTMFTSKSHALNRRMLTKKCTILMNSMASVSSVVFFCTACTSFKYCIIILISPYSVNSATRLQTNLTSKSPMLLHKNQYQQQNGKLFPFSTTTICLLGITGIFQTRKMNFFGV